MAPFRSMLLTGRSGPHCLAPRAHGVPVYPMVFPHSSMPLSRRTALGCLASSGELGERPRHPRREALRERKVPHRRASAQSGLRVAAAGAPSRNCSPAHPAPSPCSPPAQSVGRCAARGARAPVCPQGRPRTTPSPARRNISLAAGGAPSVKAKPCGWLDDSPALTAPPLPLLFRVAAWPEKGWGQGRPNARRQNHPLNLPEGGF
jgi:hypothetical protein